MHILSYAAGAESGFPSLCSVTTPAKRRSKSQRNNDSEDRAAPPTY